MIGSGPNGLAAAVTLAAEGVDVTVYEAAATPGGGTRSVEATVPGLLHDECSGFHPFAIDSAFARRFDLTKYGVKWAWPEVQYAHPLDKGRGAAVTRSLGHTAATLGEDETRYRRLFGPVVDRFDTISTEFLQPMAHVPRHPIHLAHLGVRAVMPASVTAGLLQTEEARGLWGGVAAHAFGSLRTPLSSAIGVALGAAAHRYGWPVAVGGSQQIARALIRLLDLHGGRVVTSAPVHDIRELGPADIIMLDTSPNGAAAIAEHVLPQRTRAAYRRFRHGPAAYQLALAVEGGIPWTYEPARRAGTVHVSGSFAETAAAEQAVVSGQMPERPFVLVGQQYVADPSRAHGKTVPVDCYAHVPAGYSDDATEAIMTQLERFAPGVRDRIVKIVSRSPDQIATDNPNFVGGDIVTGAKTPGQVLLGPRLGLNPYATGTPGVYLCSAAVPPGPGAHGIAGHLAARSALAALR